MRVGILNAIHPESSKVNWGGSPIDAYIRFFESTGAAFEFAGFEVAKGQLPSSPDACDAYVITGSPRGVYDDDPWIADLSHFIRACYGARKKMIGICFGHQILAHALGGHAEKSENGWGLGLDTVDIIGSKPWMKSRLDQCSLYFAHQDQVMTLPPGAELLGSSAFCPNAFYVIDGRVLAIQGHPEFSAGIMRDILAQEDRFVDIRLHQAAVRSLDNGTPDNLVVAHWMVNFLTGQDDN
jgi:GMP synthase-like glutamine amidotransferase